jgi:hypothetical protein
MSTDAKSKNLGIANNNADMVKNEVFSYLFSRIPVSA